jgi:hypothetical protein
MPAHESCNIDCVIDTEGDSKKTIVVVAHHDSEDLIPSSQLTLTA